MTRNLYPSVKAMLAEEVLSRLAHKPVTAVSLQPMTPEFGRSGSRIYKVITNNGEGPGFILKRVSLAWDWLMRSTQDTSCRAVILWESGLFDKMPAEVAHGTLACAHDGQGWAILMEDVGGLLLPFDPFSEADDAFYLRAMAALHAQYWHMEALKSPELGLCQPRQLYQMFSPRTARKDITGDNPIPPLVVEGWELAEKSLPEDVISILVDLLDDPGPLCRALDRHPYTLIHGDWRHANQAYRPGAQQLYLLDWQLAAAAPPAVELARYMITNSPILYSSKEDVIERYRHNLAARLGDRYSEQWWAPQLALGLLGGFLQDAWALVLKASRWEIGEKYRAHWRADLEWWIEKVRETITWI